jgi:hypothetical protein
MQGLQHETVAAQGHDDIGLLRTGLAVAGPLLRQGFVGVRLAREMQIGHDPTESALGGRSP